MAGIDPTPESHSPEAIASYEELGAHFDENDPREMYTYMSSKFVSDYSLMEHVGMDGKSVLNVGCSFPIDELYYARKIGSWTSIDLSPQSVKGAEEILTKELHPDLAKKFTFKVADACDMPFEDGTFDVSVAMSTIDHIPSPEARQKAIDEMARTTKPGGYVIVTVPNLWCLPYTAGIRKMTRDKTLHYGFAHSFSPLEVRGMGEKAGLKPIKFASSISPPQVWLPGYPGYIRWPAEATFLALKPLGYFGRRVGYAFKKP
ncbi:MAG: methyltransferase domain-containing protein [Acidimicrobiaceae bacterium]|nr:methyltransferase domain-containing protein [Acidimicrobiaceae bacterium]